MAGDRKCGEITSDIGVASPVTTLNQAGGDKKASQHVGTQTLSTAPPLHCSLARRSAEETEQFALKIPKTEHILLSGR